MRILFLLVFMLAVVAGASSCAEIGSGQGEDDDATTDTDVDSDTDADSDTDVDTDTDTDADTDVDTDTDIDTDGDTDTDSDTDTGSDTDPCAEVVCDDPPDDACNGDNIVEFEDEGVCVDGECEYGYSETPCQYGCVMQDGDDVCGVDPCDGVVCNTPPDDVCSGDALWEYEDVGECVDGDCEYDYTEQSCGFGCVSQVGDDVCSGDPCEGVICDEPPDDVCDDANTLHDYPVLGECNDGDCTYDYTVVSCPFGCVPQSGDDVCSGDPCADVTCDTPPDDECNGDLLRVYNSTGVCSDGDCIYGYTDVMCPFGCTVQGGDDVCADDPCADVTCDTPPDDLCIVDTLRVYDDIGVCTDGNCDYGYTDTVCPFGCVSQVGDDVCDDTCTPTDVISDGGLELGTPNPFWTEASLNFGTPLCTQPVCAPSNLTFVAHTGSWYAWFGGITALEIGSISQTVYLGSGSASISFWLWISAHAGSATDDMQVWVDGTSVFAVTRDDWPSYTGYVNEVVDISAWADDSNHTIMFDSVTNGVSGVTNFFVDDIAVNACP